jgi:hypothetical protein
MRASGNATVRKSRGVISSTNSVRFLWVLFEPNSLPTTG